MGIDCGEGFSVCMKKTDIKKEADSLFFMKVYACYSALMHFP